MIWQEQELSVPRKKRHIQFREKNETAPALFRARNLSGRTGRGDTTFAAYVNERLNNSIEKALLYATATVSLKMETPGPIKANRKDIEEYIEKIYSDYGSI